LAQEHLKVVALAPEDTKFGSVETLEDARRCADLFRQHRGEIEGVLVTLPNFGDERAVANALRWADLDVPVLVHAFPDDPQRMTDRDRRDSFCGKISVCNNLSQYGIRFSLTSQHTMSPEGAEFRADLQRFASVCRVVRRLPGSRIGAVGTRPAAFNTVRFSEKLLERAGITIEPLDLSEVLGRAARLPEGDPKVRSKLAELSGYVPTRDTPPESLVRMAKLGVVIEDWVSANDLAATAVQCWTSLEEYYGVVPCALMSMMSNRLMPSACETDVTGVVGMYALTLASGRPSAIVDWNNNYREDPDRAVLFHCSNLPREMFVAEGAAEAPVMGFQNILAGTVGKENSFGTVVGRLRPSPFTFCRVSTEELRGRILAYVGEGTLLEEPLKTFGAYGVVEIPGLQRLLRFICENGFEHHVAINLSHSASAVEEALSKYLGWEVYNHTAGEQGM